MKLIFIGSGSAFTVGDGNYQSNMVLENPVNNKKLLIDCGTDCRLALNELGLSYRDIQDVYISHFHADHVGGLEWLAITTKLDPACAGKKMRLFIHYSMVDDLWNTVLAGGLSRFQGEDSNLSTFFDVCPVADNSFFSWEGLDLHLVQTIHVLSGYKIMPCYGLIFNVNNRKIFVTTDTQLCPAQLVDFYKSADLIFQDCETTRFKSGVHANYQELITLNNDIKQKMWLYHYNPGVLPESEKDGFRGFVKKGESFDLNNLDYC